MHDIDFLPADYVCVRTTRKNDTWLRALFVAVLALMAVGWFEQQRSFRELVAHRDRAKSQVTAVLSQVDSGARLRAELKHGEDHERLVQGLRSHASPMCWLNAVVGALPEQMLLTELHAEVDEGPEAADPKVTPQSTTSSTRKPIHQDLQRIIKQTPHRAIVISVRGAAPDDLEVSAFLRELNRTALFERVQLLFTDHQPHNDRLQRSFAIRLRTRSVIGTQRTNQPVASDDRGEPRN